MPHPHSGVRHIGFGFGGPVREIAEMSGEFHGEPVPIMVSLEAVGNTTKVIAKGFAIGSAAILFSSLAIRIVSREAPSVAGTPVTSKPQPY